MTALFARTDVIGFERLEYELTPDAIELGLGAALPATFEIGKEHGFGRGERSRRDTSQHPAIEVVNPQRGVAGLDRLTA